MAWNPHQTHKGGPGRVTWSPNSSDFYFYLKLFWFLDWFFSWQCMPGSTVTFSWLSVNFQLTFSWLSVDFQLTFNSDFQLTMYAGFNSDFPNGGMELDQFTAMFPGIVTFYDKLDQLYHYYHGPVCFPCFWCVNCFFRSQQGQRDGQPCVQVTNWPQID